jgi:lipoate---protein ligase
MDELRHLNQTLPLPAENLACDEALLDCYEAGHGQSAGVLRFWEPTQHFVVLGYANKAEAEVNLEACRSHQIPIFRRCSGGGAVLQGPGCLNYTLVLKIHDALESITETNCFVMKRNAATLSTLIRKSVSVKGFTDLALDGLKFSGNSQRRRRNFLLFHGTFLLDFDLALVQKVLRLPSKQPPYRQNRPHEDFLINLNLPALPVKDALRTAWNAAEPLETIPRSIIDAYATEKYSQDAWNLKW